MEITTISIDLAEMPRLQQVFPNLLKITIEFAILYPHCGNETNKFVSADKKHLQESYSLLLRVFKGTSWFLKTSFK